MIKLNLHGSISSDLSGRQSMEVAADGTLLEILRKAGVSSDSYSILVVNGKLVKSQVVPEDGDVVEVYPPLCGG